jgi:hypothetical protein
MLTVESLNRNTEPQMLTVERLNRDGICEVRTVELIRAPPITLQNRGFVVGRLCESAKSSTKPPLRRSGLQSWQSEMELPEVPIRNCFSEALRIGDSRGVKGGVPDLD